MDEKKTKELIQLFINQYYEARSGDNSPEVRAALFKFIKDNEVPEHVADKVHEITGTTFSPGTPENPVDVIYAKYIAEKKGGTRNRNRHRKQSNRHRKQSNRHRKQSNRHKRTHRRRARRGGNMFHGSNATAPVMCLAGYKHIPCTAFSSA
jgi:hypothetical protein